jgi:hypothetical protein
VYCIRCGARLISDERFCDSCGAPASLAAPPDRAATDTRVCPSCRVKAQAGHTYCWHCGGLLTAASLQQTAKRRAEDRIPLWTIAVGFVAGLVFIGIAAIIVLARSSSGSFDTKQADRVARIALLSDQELPGTGWEEGATGSGEAGLLNDLASNPACAAMNAQLSAVDAAFRQGRAGRAQRLITKDPTAQAMAPTRVEVQTQVYRDAGRLTEALQAQEEFLDGDGFRECLDRGLLGGLRSSDLMPKVTVRPVAASAYAPHSGIARAYNVDFSLTVIPGSEITGTFHIEVYSWQYSNARAEVVLFGAKDEVTPHLVQTAVYRTQVGLERAEKTKP